MKYSLVPTTTYTLEVEINGNSIRIPWTANTQHPTIEEVTQAIVHHCTHVSVYTRTDGKDDLDFYEKGDQGCYRFLTLPVPQAMAMLPPAAYYQCQDKSIIFQILAHYVGV